MYSNDDNTMRSQKTASNEVLNHQPKNHTAAKAAAAGIIGAALGVGGSAYAMNSSQPEVEPQPQEQPQAAPKEEPRHEKEASHKEEVAHEEEPKHEESVKPTSSQTEQPHATPAADSEDNEAIVITAVHTTTDEEGNQVMIAETNIGGRNAVMLATEDGHVQAVGIDGNNDGQLDNDEIVNVSDRNLYINGNSVEVHEAEAQPVPNEEPEVKVIAVQNNVDLNGQTVDVAAVSMNGQNVIFIDESQNGEVDVAIADINNNGQIDEGEAADLTDQHIMMPSADDVQPDVVSANQNTTDDLPDYSNDADITMDDV